MDYFLRLKLISVHMNLPMDNLTIRAATVIDLDALVGLRADLQRHVQSCNSRLWRTTDNKERRNQLRQEVLEMLADIDGRTVLALIAGNIAGFAYGRVHRKTTEIPNIVGNILGVFVETQYRNRGLGSRLVEELCVFFASQNVEEVTLRYVLGNKEAEKFWNSRGFEPVIAVANTTLKELKDRNRTSWET
jgi:ribosomal protein S18 acetylase RimI-like enzyme